MQTTYILNNSFHGLYKYNLEPAYFYHIGNEITVVSLKKYSSIKYTNKSVILAEFIRDTCRILHW